LAFSNTFGSVAASDARLAPKLGIIQARSTQAIVTIVVLVTTVRTVHVSVAHKILVDASTRVTFEELGRTREVSVATLVRRLVLAVRAVTIVITHPVVWNASMIPASKLTSGARYRITEKLSLISRVTAVIVAVAQPTAHNTNISVRTLDIVQR
jgi:hypothetical protein